MFDEGQQRDSTINDISNKLLTLNLRQVEKILRYVEHFKITQSTFLEPKICGLTTCNDIIPELRKRAGPKKSYCSNAHKQKAYRERNQA